MLQSFDVREFWIPYTGKSRSGCLKSNIHEKPHFLVS